MSKKPPKPPKPNPPLVKVVETRVEGGKKRTTVSYEQPKKK
jgi:hypothetical protein